MTTRVLVTGATGFVAGHCIVELLDQGYAVRGTVRDVSATTRYAYLTAAARERSADLDFAAADLEADAGWADAMRDCDYVLHVASPFPATPPDDERDLIEPAVDGTLRVLRAAAAAGVRRVVLTSSVAAVAYGHAIDRVHTETDWSALERSAAYQKSKTLAERAAWQFVAELPAGAGPELSVVNPGLVLGPLLNPFTSTSHEPLRCRHAWVSADRVGSCGCA